MPRGNKVITREDVWEVRHAEYILRSFGILLHTDTHGWLHYNGAYWQTEGAKAAARQLIRRSLEQRHDEVLKSVTDSDSTVAKMCEPSMANIRAVAEHVADMATASIDTFDASPDELNVANGVLNLQTGALTKHHPSQRFTYCLQTPYNPKANMRPWQEFLAEAVGGGDEVLDMLQKCVGYSLTGHTHEEKLFYVYGPTRSGKGVFTETLLGLLGSALSREVDFTTFTRDRQNDANNFDLAPLKAARFLAASESSRYERLNEAKVKQLTGGNLISCAFKYSDHFNYRPQYKIWLTSNYDVNADPHDQAVWGRIIRLEFPNSHQGEEDRGLKERLRSPEVMAGVLAWAVEGAKRWYQEGITVPGQLQRGLMQAQIELDTVRHWLEERTRMDPECFLSNERIRQSYEFWCHKNGVKPLSMVHLGRTLSRMPGIEQARETGKRGLRGLAFVGSLESLEEEEEWDDKAYVRPVRR